MNLDKLKPNNITDIIFKIDDYLDFMRTNENDAPALIDTLNHYIKDYFKTIAITEKEQKEITVKMVDEIYLKICQFQARDIHTDGYFTIIINRLFQELANNNILLFFIIDNSLRDDRFKLTTELFGISNVKTVCPYIIKDLEYSDNYTKFPIKKIEAVEKEIHDILKQQQHILYVEKDDSVNYLDNVLSIAEEYQDKYLCIFRNQAPDSGETANWLFV